MILRSLKAFAHNFFKHVKADYVFGGNTLYYSGDCSGWICKILNIMGYSIPRINTAQMFKLAQFTHFPSHTLDELVVIVVRKEDERGGHCGVVIDNDVVMDVAIDNQSNAIGLSSRRDWEERMHRYGYVKKRYWLIDMDQMGHGGQLS